MGRKVIGVVLAAGASSRFGSMKQLARFGEQTLIEHVQTVLLSSPVDEVAVVLGCKQELISQHSLPGVSVLTNETWEEGIASSIRCATEHARSKNATHLLLLVCDQPFVSNCLIDRMLVFSKSEPEKIVVSRYGDTVGIPALFPAQYFDSLMRLEGDKGAKQIIKQLKSVELIDFPEGLTDIDTQTDFLGCQASL